MNRSIEQYISLFLVACLIVFFSVGIASDGFSDFDKLKPKPLEYVSAAAEYCSTDVLSEDTKAANTPITWENERVDYSFELVSGDITSEAGFTISDEGIFSLNNPEYYQSLISSGRYVRIYVNVSSAVGSGSYHGSLSDKIYLDDFSDFDLIRTLCKDSRFPTVYPNYTDIESIYATVEVYYETKSSNFGQVPESSTYKLSYDFLDRVPNYSVSTDVPEIPDGYVFDGWYKYKDSDTPMYCGQIFPTVSGRLFYYADEVPYAKISEAVTVTFLEGANVSTLQCAIGTTLPEINSLSAYNFMAKVPSADEGNVVLGDSPVMYSKEDFPSYVITDDMTVIRYIDADWATVTFYVDGEVFNTQKVVKNSIFDSGNFKTPHKPGYDFVSWRKNEDLSGGSPSIISEDCNLYAKFNIRYYTLTYVLTDGFTYSDGNTTRSVKVTCEDKPTDHSGIGFRSKDDGTSWSCMWCDSEGVEFIRLFPIYQDTVLYSKWTRVYTNVSFCDYQGDTGGFDKRFDPHTVLDIDKDVPSLKKLGYDLVIYERKKVDGEYEYFEYDFRPLPFGGITLYYDYNLINYKVTFSSDYVSTKAVAFSAEQPLELPNVEEREGYDFLGWFFEDGTAYDGSKAYYEDLNLYDKWAIQKKTITLMSDGEFQFAFNVDYGTGLDDVLDEISSRNYNVVSFAAGNLNEEYAVIGETVFEVQVMEKVDSIKNTVKNNWKLIVGIGGGVIVLLVVISAIPKSKKRRRR